MSLSIQSATFNSSRSSGEGAESNARNIGDTFFFNVQLQLPDNLTLEPIESGSEIFTYGETPEDGDIQIILWVNDTHSPENEAERSFEMICPKMNSTMISLKKRTEPGTRPEDAETLLQGKWDSPEPMDETDLQETIQGKPISRRVIYNIPHNPRPL